jgi:alpha-L-fucosidase 2
MYSRPIFKTLTRGLALLAIGASAAAGNQPQGDPTTTIWFQQPANHTINEGLPVGNGRLGGMIPGGIARERIAINEDSVWSGWVKTDSDNPAALEALPKIRQLFASGQPDAAQELILNSQVWGKEPNDQSVWDAYGTYQMLAALILETPHLEQVSNYFRSLDLDEAIARVEYEVDGVTFRREVYSSYPDQVMVLHLSASQPGKVNIRVALERPDSDSRVSKVNENTIRLEGAMQAPEGVEPLRYAALVHAEISGGKILVTEDAMLHITCADSITLRIAGGTNYLGLDAWPVRASGCPLPKLEKQLAAALQIPESSLRQRHIQDHRGLFRRTSISLGQTTEKPSNLPTDRRLTQVMEGAVDPVLEMLYFHFSRYLLIGSSRPGSLAANLQGIWADSFIDQETGKWNYYVPWSGDYHTNINVQMNYWPAGPFGLPECQLPLNELIAAMPKAGELTARIQHGCGGWTTHTMHNIWGHTAPGGWATWGHFPMAGPWMASHLWEHYLFTRDQEFLAKHLPILAGSATFVLDWLIEDPDTGLWISGPSASPENRFAYPDGTEGYFCMAPTMDQMIAAHILGAYAEAESILGSESPLRHRALSVMDKLKGPEIGPDGRILEWSEPYAEPEPGHRHISHLYGLHPADQITWSQTPDLAAAARKTLDHRLAHGGAHTGWSRAWVVNFFARLGDGEVAYEHLLALLRHSTLPNLFDTHPPFQIDGNFGAIAGMAEMLLQSHERDEQSNTLLRLLPALPAAWSEGSIDGLWARGNIRIAMQWSEGRVTRLTLQTPYSQRIRIIAGQWDSTLDLPANHPVTITPP